MALGVTLATCSVLGAVAYFKPDLIPTCVNIYFFAHTHEADKCLAYPPDSFINFYGTTYRVSSTRSSPRKPLSIELYIMDSTNFSCLAAAAAALAAKSLHLEAAEAALVAEREAHSATAAALNATATELEHARAEGALVSLSRLQRWMGGWFDLVFVIVLARVAGGGVIHPTSDCAFYEIVHWC